MSSKLRENLKVECGLSEDEIELALLYFIPSKVRRGEKVLEIGAICEYAIYVEKGCLRSFVVNKKGRQSTMYLFPDNSWVPDMHCFLDRNQATSHWDAVEDSVIHKLHFSGYEKLCRQIPALTKFFRSQQFNYLNFSQKRLLTTLYTKAEDRYASFLEEFPLLSRRLPINLIASYIGVAPESLSRIRKQIIRK